MHFQEKRDQIAVLSALVAQHLPPQQVPDDQWEEIIELAVAHGLGPMLYWVAREAGMDVSGSPLWHSLKANMFQTSARHMILENAVKQVDTRLAAVGIRTLWLKGIVLARTIYPRPSLRPMSDLDVLIPFDQRELALSTVQSLGYQFGPDEAHLFDAKDDLAQKVSHHYHLQNTSVEGLVLELHSRLLRNLDTLMSIERLDWFWTHTQVVDIGAFTFLGPSPEAHVLYLSAHAILHHGEAETTLRQYFDIHRLVSAYALDWNVVTEQAAVLGWSYAVGRALALAVSLFDTPVPPLVLLNLKNAQTEDMAQSIHLQGKGSGWEKMRVSLNILSRRERLNFLSRVLFPRGSYMRYRYTIASDRPVWPYYLYRWANQAREIIWWIWEHSAMLLRGKRR